MKIQRLHIKKSQFHNITYKEENFSVRKTSYGIET
jgi:hypothetical protein